MTFIANKKEEADGEIYKRIIKKVFKIKEKWHVKKWKIKNEKKLLTNAFRGGRMNIVDATEKRINHTEM